MEKIEDKKTQKHYYCGRHEIKILHIFNKFAIVEHHEDGYTGNADTGYKKVRKGEIGMSHFGNLYDNKIIQPKNSNLKQSKTQKIDYNPNLEKILESTKENSLILKEILEKLKN